jgi:hypothetical protein
MRVGKGGGARKEGRKGNNIISIRKGTEIAREIMEYLLLQRAYLLARK